MEDNEFIIRHEKILCNCKLCGRKPKLKWVGGDWGYTSSKIIVSCSHSKVLCPKTAVSSITMELPDKIVNLDDHYLAVVDAWNMLNKM